MQPDLLDKNAIYQGAYIKDQLIGIVSYVEHAYVLEQHRGKGVYKLLWEYRNMKIRDLHKQTVVYCNVSSIKHFLNNGYQIEKALFKVVRK